ncbi:SH3 domain-containing protein [Noviherbaspirillum autotrophicum]|uniref:SH3 domain-containing protein n=1 Tax=Noviherbaspirillum autotrophicum TaxID=709839 RepID=UPI0006935AFD|nr:SH3 domain-containing protein [Noviherbaspirillum autotrophicum]
MKTRLLALAFLLTAGAAHAESAITLRSTELQADAQSDAATLATVPQGTRLDVLSHKGAWGEVKTAGGQRGWVRMSSLKSEAGTAVPEAPAGALNRLLSSGRTSNTATVTTGVRGLPRETHNDMLDDAGSESDNLKAAREFERDKAATQ